MGRQCERHTRSSRHKNVRCQRMPLARFHRSEFRKDKQRAQVERTVARKQQREQKQKSEIAPWQVSESRRAQETERSSWRVQRHSAPARRTWSPKPIPCSRLTRIVRERSAHAVGAYRERYPGDRPKNRVQETGLG